MAPPETDPRSAAPESSSNRNIARYLPYFAARQPFKKAVVFPRGRDSLGRVSYTHLTYQQLDVLSSRYVRGLERLGVRPGQRVLLMVKPSLEFLALTFALFRLGTVPVLIDPGMGFRNLVSCVAEVEPEVFLAVPLAHLVSLLAPRSFRSVETRVTVGGRRWLWGGTTLAGITHEDGSPYPCADCGADDMAAILFTTGSTGPPKGVRYTHGIFDTQVKVIQKTYGICQDDVDLPGFPLFGLYSVAWGMTSVLPDMDPTRPAHVDPRKICEAVENFGVTTSFGSPAIWRRVGAYCEAEGIRFPSMKRILMAGAPVPGETLNQFVKILPNGDTHTPYGATESLPVASISGSEVVRETWEATRQGRGTCVGKPLPGNLVQIIRVLEEEIPEWDEALVLPQGEIGEIVVRSPLVTPGYFNRDTSTRLAKIRDGDYLRHRMGDVGYLDDQGRLWFCGRKAHRVETPEKTYYSVCCEAIFNEHPRVFRSALVGVKGKPRMIVEPLEGQWPHRSRDQAQFTEELLALGKASELTREIEDILFHPGFPVDIRHNAKIFREKLAVWARGELRAVL
jgi:acyl-CoA synthetase (AMP-forming)/AMP-acid ligase II